MKQHARGVTLIELMVVIAVLAIIASIAVPSYRSYLRRAQRADATAELLRVRTAQEKYFLQNGRYATVDEFDNPKNAGGLGFTGTSEHGYYTIAIDPATFTNTTFTAIATATGGQVDDAPCQTFAINEAGVRTSGPNGITTCWK
jgi:type IV pilus assembly protein PilE